MAQFINRKEDLVIEAIDGSLKASGGTLTRLDGYPHIKVVLHGDWDKSKAALVSGGGSGHEPAHAGFVGRGMLTAAVCGEVFASPSVDAVLAGILAVTGPAGCLLIVKNYTGDRLNFGLAAERAREQGLKVSLVIVDDDVALPDVPQARGVAGTLFVHKIAGALAERGASLEEVTAAAERIVENTATIGMSLDTCQVPGSPKEDRIPQGSAELGLGIHGEPGIEQISFSSASQAMDLVAQKLEPQAQGDTQVALLNNLGGATALEMAVLADELTRTDLGQRVRWIIGPAPLMTSLDMRGFSLSLLPATDDDVALLRDAQETPAWPGVNEFTNISAVPVPDGVRVKKPEPSSDDDRRAFIERCCALMIDAREDLNALDAKSGDGDTGSTLAAAATALLDGTDRLPLADLGQLCRAISIELSETMGGSSGVQLSIFFAAAGEAVEQGRNLQDALKVGLDRICHVGGAKPGDRTMVDALAPALDALPQGLAAAAKAARKGADETASITRAGAGRAAYVSAEKLSGNKDPGAEAVARLFEGLAG
ncbi:MAG: dihydroxyacetone kinase subunit DhaK [Geminicoccaceae bacterium]